MNRMLDLCRDIFLTALLAAVMVAAMIPSGFMPSTQNDGEAKIVICTAMGMGEMPAGKGATKQPSCPYAPVLAQSAITPIALFVSFISHFILYAGFLPQTELGQFPVHYSAQGPPAHLHI